MSEKYNIAVVGATGNVGREILQILEQREFPINNIYCLASSRSKGKKIEFKDQKIIVEDLSKFDFNKVQIGFIKQVNKKKQNYLIVDSNKKIYENKKIIINKMNKLVQL